MTALLLDKALDAEKRTMARYLQKHGLTLSEIADRIRVEREVVVQALYWDVVGRRP